MKLRFASVCDGIGAAACAWTPLGWEFVWKSEIEAFPLAVTHHHWPAVPNYGDMTEFKDWSTDERIDVLVGGTPCQAFSVAGLRRGLADPRGNLTLTFLAVVAQHRPQWVVWENVPGVLSDRTGAFGALLGGLGKLGYGFAYRVLDAQYFGVAQRRRRVFVVGCAGGEWQRAAAVLFERESLCGNPAPRREKGEGAAPTLSARTRGGGGLGTDAECDGAVIPIQEISKRTGVSTDDVRCGIGIGSKGDAMFTLQRGAQHGVAIGIDGGEVGFALRANASHSGDKGDGGVNTTLVAQAYRTSGNCGAWDTGDRVDALTTGTDPNSHVVLPEVSLALCARDFNGVNSACDQGAPLIPEVAGALDRECGGTKLQAQYAASGHLLNMGMAVRRLTPRECERLQGFPDDWTAVPYRGKPAADGPRYKALGNSMAVPVMRWIGRRIEGVEGLQG